MPVDTPHPDYEKAAPIWSTMRDVLGGPLELKAKGEEYLPRLSGQTVDQYSAYKARAQVFNATGKTHSSLTGFVFRKDPATAAPATLETILQDCTKTGVDFYDYAKTIFQEVLGLGRAGTLIDFDGDAENRPFLVRYAAENVINWKVARIGGKMRLSLLVLFELDPEWIPLDEADRRNGPPDTFTAAEFPQWRVYELRQDGDTAAEPYAVCTVYRKKKGKGTPRGGKSADEFVPVNQFLPTRRGVPLHRIPFVFHNAADSLPAVGRVPLQDMAEIQISHYRTSADYENACHMIGVPTPYVFGVDLKDNALSLGTTTAIVSSEANAKCGFMEFSGSGLSALKDAMDRKERQMAALGAKMLEPEAKKAEAYDTVAVRSAAETSNLMAIAIAVSESLEDVLQWVAWWLGTEADPEDLQTVNFELNTEFVSGALRPDALQALVAAYNGGALTDEDLFHNLQRGEVLAPDQDLETWRAGIEQTRAALPTFTQTPPGAA